jgi:hypothetical protein
LTELDASSDVELDAGSMATLSIGLLDPVRTEPALGVNTAVSCAVEAAKAAEQRAVTLCALGETGTSPQVGIAAPPFSNATVPDGNGAPMLELTVAVKVTVSFVTAVPGDASSAVEVASQPGSGVGSGAATDVAGPLSAALLPRAFDASVSARASPLRSEKLTATTDRPSQISRRTGALTDRRRGNFDPRND